MYQNGLNHNVRRQRPIISIAQQARPNVIGHNELLRAHAFYLLQCRINTFLFNSSISSGEISSNFKSILTPSFSMHRQVQ